MKTFSVYAVLLLFVIIGCHRDEDEPQYRLTLTADPSVLHLGLEEFGTTRITIFLQDPDGHPMSNYPVKYWLGDDAPMRWQNTDSQGRFTVTWSVEGNVYGGGRARAEAVPSGVGGFLAHGEVWVSFR